MANHKKLIVFQKADELAFQIYESTQQFPREEVYGLTAQLRRAALSIPTNIVEGHARKSKKEFKHFMNIALGSLAETQYLFEFSKRLGYQKNGPSGLENLIDEVGRLLWSFYRFSASILPRFRAFPLPHWCSCPLPRFRTSPLLLFRAFLPS